MRVRRDGIAYTHKHINKIHLNDFQRKYIKISGFNINYSFMLYTYVRMLLVYEYIVILLVVINYGYYNIIIKSVVFCVERGTFQQVFSFPPLSYFNE